MSEVQLATLRKENAELRGVIVDFLEGPYHGQAAISASIVVACHKTQHKAKRTSGTCVCGKRPA